MAKDKKSGKTVEQALADFDQELKRIDRLIEDQGVKIKDSVEDIEDRFKSFLEEHDIDVGELKEKTTRELARLKKEADHTAKTLKSSFNYFRAQYKNRKD